MENVDVETIKRELKKIEGDVSTITGQIAGIQAQLVSLHVSKDQREMEFENLVERVSKRLVLGMYQAVGQNVIKKFFWLIGIGALAFLMWAGGTGRIKIGLPP